MSLGTVVVIDDSAFSRRRFVAKPLLEAGYEVYEGCDGEEGVAIVTKHNPICVTTDLLMPVLDGFGVLESLSKSHPGLPVIVASADIQETSRERCVELGAFGFINKPFKPAELLSMVESAVGGAII